MRLNLPPDKTIELILSGHNVKFIREYQFETSRKWRFDFSLPDYQIAIEYEGGVHSGGRHVRGTGYSKDCEKYNAAAILGWSVLRYTSDMINKNPGKVLDDVILIIKSRKS